MFVRTEVKEEEEGLWTQNLAVGKEEVVLEKEVVIPFFRN